MRTFFWVRLLGFLMIFIGLGYVFLLNQNMWNYIPIVIGIFLLLLPTLTPKIRSKQSSKAIRAVGMGLLFGALLYAGSFAVAMGLIWNSGKQRPEKGADALIVLGAGLLGDRVSATLAFRLDEAATYLKQSPSCIVVVSGGQGRDEKVTEAFAMKKYLIARGIPPHRIIEEGKSTSTEENFIFSKKILDAHFKEKEYRCVYVTNQFHVFRAGRFAEKAGFRAEGLPSRNYNYTLLNNYTREHLAILWYYASKYII